MCTSRLTWFLSPRRNNSAARKLCSCARSPSNRNQLYPFPLYTSHKIYESNRKIYNRYRNRISLFRVRNFKVRCTWLYWTAERLEWALLPLNLSFPSLVGNKFRLDVSRDIYVAASEFLFLPKIVSRVRVITVDGYFCLGRVSVTQSHNTPKLSQYLNVVQSY